MQRECVRIFMHCLNEKQGSVGIRRLLRLPLHLWYWRRVRIKQMLSTCLGETLSEKDPRLYVVGSKTNERFGLPQGQFRLICLQRGLHVSAPQVEVVPTEVDGLTVQVECVLPPLRTERGPGLERECAPVVGGCPVRQEVPRDLVLSGEKRDVRARKHAPIRLTGVLEHGQRVAQGDFRVPSEAQRWIGMFRKPRERFQPGQLNSSAFLPRPA